MPKPFTENERKMINQRLIAYGNRFFSTQGLKKTSIEELADAAGISKAAFYLFYKSKEDLYMDVVEQAEVKFRQEILSALEQPGPSARSRLTSALLKAFHSWKEIPILQFFTSGDIDLLYRRVSGEKIQAHIESDRVFIQEFVQHSQRAGIPITVAPEQISGLMYALFFTSLHQDDTGVAAFDPAFTLLVELTAAYCLGEIVPETEDKSTNSLEVA